MCYAGAQRAVGSRAQLGRSGGEYDRASRCASTAVSGARCRAGAWPATAAGCGGGAAVGGTGGGGGGGARGPGRAGAEGCGAALRTVFFFFKQKTAYEI